MSTTIGKRTCLSYEIEFYKIFNRRNILPCMVVAADCTAGAVESFASKLFVAITSAVVLACFPDAVNNALAFSKYEQE